MKINVSLVCDDSCNYIPKFTVTVDISDSEKQSITMGDLKKKVNDALLIKYKKPFQVMCFYGSKSNLMQDFEKLSVLTNNYKSAEDLTVYGRLIRPLGKNRSCEAFFAD